MNKIPLICPECKSASIVEESNGMRTREFYKWDEAKQRYVFEFDDNENFGDAFIECGECNYRYSHSDYQKWLESNPITQGEYLYNLKNI